MTQNSHLYLRLILVTGLLYISFNGFAQQLQNDTSDYTLNMTDGKVNFTELLPFDQFFRIKVTNINVDKVDRIELRLIITEGKTATKAFLKDRKALKEYREENPDKVKFIDSVSKDNFFGNNNAFLFFGFKLRPNIDYVIEIETSKQRSLTEEEKTAMEPELLGDPVIKRTYNRFAKLKFDSPNLDDNNAFKECLNSFTESVAKKLTSINPAYKLKEIDGDDDLLKNFATNFKKFIPSLSNEVSDLLTNVLISLEDKDTTIQKRHAELRKVFSNASWATMEKGDNADYKKINDKLDNFLEFIEKAVSLEKKTNSDSIETIDNLSAEIELIKSNLNSFLLEKERIYKKYLEYIIAVNIYVSYNSGNTYPADFVKHSNMYLTMDLGYAYVGGLDRGNPYAGANIYFRPVNKNIPLSQYKRFGDFMGVRTSLLLGFSVVSIKQDNVRKGLLDDNKALVMGVGYRILPWLKINSGAYLYYKFSTNPLISQERYRFTGSPFISLSIDLDMKDLLSGVGQAIFKTQ